METLQFLADFVVCEVYKHYTYINLFVCQYLITVYNSLQFVCVYSPNLLWLPHPFHPSSLPRALCSFPVSSNSPEVQPLLCNEQARVSSARLATVFTQAKTACGCSADSYNLAFPARSCFSQHTLHS